MLESPIDHNAYRSGPAATARALKILVVDDEPVVLKFIEASLRAAGFEHLVFAQNGSGVPSLAVEECPRLIIMDVMMPKGNGLRALRMLKDNARTARIPVILTSGFDVHALGECARDHASSLVPKPFTAERIVSHVEQLLAV